MTTNPYVIGDVDGFSPQIARLVGMMTYVRHTTYDAVRGLTVEQLDHLHDRGSNSIGALLMHIAAVETAYQVDTFLGRDLNVAELLEWGAALDLGDRARNEIRGREVGEYIEILARVRKKTLAELARHDDQWLYDERPFWRGEPANNYFKWFHTFEDELNHRGQIRFLMKRLPL